jgi:hypothetical protein
MAACYLQIEAWALCIAACNSALEINPAHPKALYRRAQARFLPMSSGTVENNMALKDLQAALKLNPSNPTVRKAFNELKLLLINQRYKDKVTFGNLFERAGDDSINGGGDHKNNDDAHSNHSGMTVQGAYETIQDMKSTCETYRRDGDHSKAVDLQARIDEIEQMMKEYELDKTSTYEVGMKSLYIIMYEGRT